MDASKKWNEGSNPKYKQEISYCRTGEMQSSIQSIVSLSTVVNIVFSFKRGGSQLQYNAHPQNAR
jgi:hypothetical protein